MEAFTIPVKLYIHYATSTFLTNKFVVATADFTKSSPDKYVLLETREIELTVNQPEPIDIIGLQVDLLREQKAKIAADAQQKIAVVEDKIQQLLCIDYTPEEDEIPY
ncbi:hypothetical protein NPT69_002871 [Salmonella enterica subsp. enterica serovar Yaba]|nr:hypothetical protein [Salmonella enterica subsp. enterica serovar Yaba]